MSFQEREVANMKISITGATGFIGGYILTALAEKGHSLRALARPYSNRRMLNAVGAEVVNGDIMDEEAAKALVEGADVIVHNLHCQDAKATDDPKSYIGTNVCASFWLLENARRAGCKQFIFTSSGAVFGETVSALPMDERYPTFPTHIYGAYKVSVEAMCAAYYHQFKMNTVCLRPVYVYGIAPKLENSLWYDLVARLMRGEEIRTARGGNVVNVETVAEAVALAVGNPAAAGQRYNLSDCYVPWQTVADLAKELLSLRPHISQVTETVRPPTILNDKAKQLGVNFRGAAGVKEYVTDLVQRLAKAHRIYVAAAG
jgi:nucleoside-diphosphate-sugar epimerase